MKFAGLGTGSGAGWIGAVLATALLAGGARGEDAWLVPGSVYVELGGGAEYVNLPEQTAIVAFPGVDFSATDDEFWLWSAEARVGIADGPGLALPDPVGRNARIELGARYSHGTSQSNRTGDGLVIIPPDLTPVVFPVIPDSEAHINSMFETWDADLIYQTDVLWLDRLAFSPFLGLTYTRLSFDNDYKVVWPGIGPLELNDEVRAHYYGVALGFDLTVRPIDVLDVTLGLRGDLMGAAASMHANLDGFDESDNDQNFAGRATTSLGIGLRLGQVTLRAEGFARYLSYLPVADHPTVGSLRPSNIDGEEMWSVGGRGSLTLWF